MQTLPAMCDSAFLPDSKLRFPPEILNKVVPGLLDLLILLAQLCFGRFLYFRSFSASLSLKLSFSKKVESRVCKTKDFGAAVSCVAVSLQPMDIGDVWKWSRYHPSAFWFGRSVTSSENGEPQGTAARALMLLKLLSVSGSPAVCSQ